MNMEYYEIMWAEMKPDIYDGEECDQVRPQWWAYAEGDMDGDTFDHPIELNCKDFPAGTKVTISVPCCPVCSQQVEMCKADDGCVFDWDEWVGNNYS